MELLLNFYPRRFSSLLQPSEVVLVNLSLNSVLTSPKMTSIKDGIEWYSICMERVKEERADLVEL